MTPQQRSVKYVIALVLWTIFLAYVLFAPAKEFSTPGIFSFPGLDKIVHFILFAILTFLSVKALGEQGINFRLKTVMFVLVLIGLSTELIQIGLPDRSGSFLDFLADAAGIAVVIYCFHRS